MFKSRLFVQMKQQCLGGHITMNYTKKLLLQFYFLSCKAHLTDLLMK